MKQKSATLWRSCLVLALFWRKADYRVFFVTSQIRYTQSNRFFPTCVVFRVAERSFRFAKNGDLEGSRKYHDYRVGN